MSDYQRIIQWIDDDYTNQDDDHVPRFTPAERSLLAEVADRLKHKELREPDEECIHSFFNRHTRKCIKCGAGVPAGSYISETSSDLAGNQLAGEATVCQRCCLHYWPDEILPSGLCIYCEPSQ